ncbi:MAG: sulfatase-like hydrolase/transferase [Candidatus Latescibacteria bacterium]|jgi:choline-sulfatase|nr:sulfatase-like hydrolase/transferase [Candidatus Latescibacterota bacterium]
MPRNDKRPNILFVLTDQQRGDWYGTNPDVPVRTPSMDALGERGVLFTNAVCPSPLCVPSRACVASGLEYERCGVPSNDAYWPDGRPSYHRALRDQAGYHVMACGKFHIGNNQSGKPAEFHWGLDGRRLMDEWGLSDCLFNAGKNQATILVRNNPEGTPQDAYMAYLHQHGWMDAHIEDYVRRNTEGVWTATFPTELPDEVYFDSWITRNALELLDRAPSGDPWYLEVDLQNPHHPWDITEEMHALYRDPLVDFPQPTEPDEDVSPEIHNEVRRNYAAMLEHLDGCLGRLLDRLRERGDLDNTLVLFSSDHGEMLGDYGQWQKISPLQASIGVPLAIAGPGVARLRLCDAPVTTVDLPATFLDLAGASPMEDVDSRSMARYLSGETDTHRDVVYSGLGSWRLAFDGRYKLVQGYDPERRRGGDVWEPWSVDPLEAARLRQERPAILYDVQTSEGLNVARRHPDIVDRLTDALNDLERGE